MSRLSRPRISKRIGERIGELRAGDGYQRWTRRTDGPLLLIALAFLVVFVVPLYHPDLPKPVEAVFLVVNVVTWFAFAIDYLVRLALARNRQHFLRRHVPDLLVLVVPFLRPLRLLRVVGLVGATTRRAGARAQVRTTAGVAAAVSVLVVVCGGLALDSERGQEDANIVTAEDALWWAATTVTTVGYGDRYPTTTEGRLAGVLLMIGGVALLGVLTASVAAWFIKRFTAVEEIEQAVHDEGSETARMLAEISARMERLEQLLATRPGPEAPVAGEKRPRQA